MIIRHVDRYAEIMRVLTKHGLGDLVETLGLDKVLPGWRRPEVPRVSRREHRARHLRLALEELGPTFVKLGQVLSTRPDILPLEYIYELENLQDEVPPFPFEQARDIIEAELGRPLIELFPEFEPRPIASASLAQVHPARLFSGDSVVVKVQRPNLVDTIGKDIDILRSMARIAQSHSKYGQIYDFPGIVDQLDRTIRQEIDFNQERRNMQIIGENLAEFERIYVPAVYPGLSGRRVLTMERVSGVKVSEIGSLDIDVVAVAEEFARAYIKQIAIDGIFHADPHPGNLFIRDDGTVALVDFGMVGRLDKGTRRLITRLMLAFMQDQGDEVARATLDLGEPAEGMDVRGFQRSVSALVDRYHNLPLQQINIGQAIVETLQVALRYHLRIPGALSLLGKTLLYSEGIARQMYPGLNFVNIVKSYSHEIMVNQLRADLNPASLAQASLEITELAVNLPRRMNDILDKFEEGEIRIVEDIIGLEDAKKAVRHSVSSLALAIIAAALLVSATILITSQDQAGSGQGALPLGYIVFVLGLLLGLYVVYRTVRSGR